MFLVVSLLLTMGAMAQIDTNKEYRIKEKASGLYMNVGGTAANTHGEVYGSERKDGDAANVQIFKFIDANNGQYYVKSKSGEYITYTGTGAGWNVNGDPSESNAHALTFEETATVGELKIKCYNQSKSANKYFKWEYVGASGNYHPFNDADNGAVFVLELNGKLTYNVKVLGTSDAAAGVSLGDNIYKNGASLESETTLTKSDLTAMPVDGMHAVINIEDKNVYVSYFSNSTKFYTIKGHSVDLYYMSLNPDYCDGENIKLTNKNTPQDNRGLWMFEAQSDGGYKVYNYSTGLTKVLGMTGSEADARASMVDRNSPSHSIVFDGTIKFDGKASYIKIKGSDNNYWNKRGNYLALWADNGAVGDNGSTFFMEEADYTLFPDEYIFEYTPKNANTLWYKSSAKSGGSSNAWQEYALPLGNGELGCMVFGEVQSEEIQFNEKTLWSGPANTIGAGGGNRTFVNFGSLFITDNTAQSATDYVRYLDLEEGIAGVEFKKSNGTRQVRRYFSSAPDSVIVINYKNIGSEKLNLTFSMTPCSDISASAVTYSDGMASFTGAMEAVKYAARVHVATDNGATVSTASNGITVSNATEVTFFLKGGTNFNGDMTVFDNYFTNETQDDVNNRIKAEIEKAAAKEYATLEAAHIADFSALTKRMTFSLGLETPSVDTKALIDNYYPNNQDGNSTDNDHLFLEQLYFHYGRYLAISSNRKPIAAPNNLQGIWNNLGRQASHGVWNSDIHTNINIQMNYWPTEVTNLSDLHMPFLNFIIRGAKSAGWKQVAKDYNNGDTKGWSVLTESSLYNSMSKWGSNYLVANVWYTSHLWMHYRYTQDKEFLKKAFPVMWSCAEFWFHRMKNVNGEYLAPNEYSPEHGPGHNNTTGEDGTAHAQQMISYLFANLMEAIEILDASEHGLTQAQIEKLNDYYLHTDKGLATESCARANNGVTVGTTLLREWKYSAHTSGETGHRHMSHLMALYPMEQITPESQYFTPAVNSLRHRGDAATGWSMGWKVNLWARAQDGDHAHIIIKNALQHAGGNGGVYYNLFDAHPPFQIDGNFGVCAGMAEMLMQSAHGYINVLPAMPQVWKKQGAVTGMKAVGNFTVDFNWKDGKCQKATITSNAGAKLQVRCNRGAMEIGKALVTVNGKKATVAVDENGIATISNVKKGDVVAIDFTRTAESYVESHELDVTEAGYATLYLGFDATIPELTGENCGVYTITSVGDGYAHMEAVTGTLPANTGVIVKANKGKYIFVQSSTAPANTNKGLLEGTLTREEITKEDGKVYYILSNEYDPIGLYIAGNSRDNKTFWNDANKAYLVISEEEAQGSIGYRFDDENTTSIEEVKTVNGNVKAIYDLQGRKVNTPNKGLYIVDGKKVLIK